MLNHMNMNYDMLYKNDKTSKYGKILYKENTNVFCYYIIKTIMLFFYDDFFKWCNLNNSNLIKFEMFCKHCMHYAYCTHSKNYT